MGENKDYISWAEEKGSINVSEEVLAILAANATMETDGVVGLSGVSGKDYSDKLGRKTIARGVKVKTDEDDSVTIDVYIMIRFGNAIGELSKAIQENIRNAIESVTGLDVKAVNIHVCGVIFEKKTDK